MFIIDQYAGEDFHESFVQSSLDDFCKHGLPMYAFRDYRDVFIAYCNL